jgi:hypothetical protein
LWLGANTYPAAALFYVDMQVATEHAILAQLAQQTLSFEVPKALPALNTGAPYLVLSNGAAACVFEIIPGATGWWFLENS